VHLQGSVQQRRRRSDIMQTMKITLEYLRCYAGVPVKMRLGLFNGPPPLPNGRLSPGDDSDPNILPTTSRSHPGNNMTLSICAIAVGAALGALLRWFFATRFNALFPQLPPGTLAANILGGYLIGIAMATLFALPALAPEWRLLTVTGFLGGLTTFSTFSAEVVTALLEGRSLWALATVAAHVLGSIIMTLCGVGTVRVFRALI